MAAWRGHRALTWITGVVAFLGSIGTAFTGYLSQSNFDAQWISAEAKDGLNSVGIGAWFNVLNPGQMLLWHVVLLPFVVGVLIVAHVVLVRRHGVVPPLGRRGPVTRPWPPRPPPRPAATERRGPHPRLALVPDAGLRPGQGVRHRPAGGGAPHGRPGCRVLLAGREGHHPARLGHRGASRRRGDRNRRAGRHDDRRDLRRRRTTATRRGQTLGPLALQKWAGVRLPGRPGPGPRAHALGRRDREPAAGGRAGRVEGRRRDPAHRVGHGLRRRPRQGPGRRPGQGRGRRLRAGAGAGRQLPGARPQRRPRGRVHVRRHLLRRGPDPVAAAARRRRLPRGPGAGAATSAATSGG